MSETVAMRRDGRRMRAVCRVVLSLVGGVAVSGCVVDAHVDPSGGARLRLRYRLVSVAHFEPSKARMQSPDVRLVNATMTPDKWATFDLETTDVRKLSTAPAFSGVRVSLDDEADGSRTLVVTAAAPDLPAPYLKYLGNDFRLAIELPGDIVGSNATTVAAHTASWVVPIGGTHDPVRFNVTFRPPARGP